MTDEMALLCGTAALVALLHTLLGADHYLPFIAMSRAGGWSLRKTVLITLMCGIGHVLSSAALGAVGIALGLGVFTLEVIEGWRGDLAGWLLFAFGLVYLLWGVRLALRNRPHTHWHVHADGTVHQHEHVHHAEHMHVHQETGPRALGTRSNSGPVLGAADSSGRTRSTGEFITPWILFTLFLFGPCEPLIPILMYPAASGRIFDVVLVTTNFGGTTLATMITIVVVAQLTVGTVRFGRLERYSHALAGLAVLVCGAAIQVGL